MTQERKSKEIKRSMQVRIDLRYFSFFFFGISAYTSLTPLTVDWEEERTLNIRSVQIYTKSSKKKLDKKKTKNVFY